VTIESEVEKVKYQGAVRFSGEVDFYVKLAQKRLSDVRVANGKYGREKQLRDKAEKELAAHKARADRLAFELLAEQAKCGDLREELRGVRGEMSSATSPLIYVPASTPLGEVTICSTPTPPSLWDYIAVIILLFGAAIATAALVGWLA